MKKMINVLILMALVGNLYAQDYDKQVKDLQADLTNDSRAQEQVITLTRKNLALEIDNRKLHERIDELNRTVVETAREKKDLELELREAEAEIAKLEKSNEEFEKKNQELKSLLDKIRTLVISSPKS